MTELSVTAINHTAPKWEMCSKDEMLNNTRTSPCGIKRVLVAIWVVHSSQNMKYWRFFEADLMVIGNNTLIMSGDDGELEDYTWDDVSWYCDLNQFEEIS
jgi:hypothetical protein